MDQGITMDSNWRKDQNSKIMRSMIGTVHGHKIKRDANYKLLEKYFNFG